MSVEIVEVIMRSTQGMTRPFICRADDELTYFVKGIDAGRSSQVFEWIAGNLAMYLDINIAPFEIVTVPEMLLEIPNDMQLNQLGAGPAFGSCRQSIMELSYSSIIQVPISIRKDILAFDWWIRNADRTLSANGGNPNLFLEPETQKLVVIDHNQAFDSHFSELDFIENHVFSEQMKDLLGDWVLRDEYCDKFSVALKKWPEICDSIPKEWMFVDPEQTVPVNFSLEEIYATLVRCSSKNTFWNCE